jgi:uncharacterized protein (DUF433 family)
MSTASTYPHLTMDSAGCMRIVDSRYTVRHLAAEHYQHGWTAEELLRQHPDLRPEEVYAALTYFYDHYDAIVAELRQSSAVVDALGVKPAVSRDELLRRRAVQGS